MKMASKAIKGLDDISPLRKALTTLNWNKASMAASPTLAGSARNKAIDVFPLSITQAFRIAMYPPCPSMPDSVSAMLQITSALARVTEKRTAAAADIKSVELGEVYPSPSAKVKAKKRRQKQDAFAERMKKEL